MRELLVSFMGSIFGVIYDFYRANAVALNSVVVIYGFVIVLSWSNLAAIRRRLVDTMISQARAMSERFANSTPSDILAMIEIPWEQAVGAARFPLVARQSALYPLRKTVSTVQALLPAETLLKEALAVLSVDNKQRSAPSTKK